MTDATDKTRDVVPAEGGGGVIAKRPRRGRGRWLRRLILLIAVPVLVLAVGSYIYAVTGRYVTTDNAYVKAHIVAISTDIDGRIVDVMVRNDQRVAAGDLLFRLDPDPHWLRLKLAEARVESVANEIDGMRAEYRQIQVEIDDANETVAYFDREAKRQRELARRGVATTARLDEAEFELASAKQQVRGLREKIRKVLADLGGDPARSSELHPKYMEALADKEMAELNLAYTEVRAPADGVVTRVRLEAGEWLEEGEPAFGLIQVDDTWVEANLKETELTYVQEGQSVEVTLDAYPDQTWPARITSIAPATGAEFAVLPPQNASGNWVKVVQRVPVRIDLEEGQGRPPLRAGMTASIAIDTGRERELLTAAKKAIAGLSADGTVASATE